MEAANAPPALFFAARGGAVSSFLPRKKPGERSAERRTKQSTPGEARRALGEGHTPLGAPPRRFWASGPCFRGANGGLFAHLIPRLSPRSSGPVQPSKAEPRSGPGRLPDASRVRGCEPRPRAPHQPAPGLPGSGPLKSLRHQDASRWRPRTSKAIRAYIPIGIKSRYF
jgi:hypothetical protein